MSRPVVGIDRLSKRYTVGEGRSGYGTLRDTLANAMSAPFRNRRGSSANAVDTLWALKDVSFEVQPGEVVGIVGRNGAGKSTLLKILSRITEPSAGSIRLRGRVASLLEVGTGFHGELSGRENIYLNGAILGMRRHEIQRRFDEIVAFAEIERFLDTPVKRYSSGMYTRLAFGVAAHLEPEILIVDEVLAVGDVAFQKKCLGKMDEVARSGRTVLFVSHNMGTVADLCSRAIYLAAGKLVADGPASQIIQEYLSAAEPTDHVDLKDWRLERSGNGPMRVGSVALENADGEPQSVFRFGDTIVFRIGIDAPVSMPCLVGLSIRDSLGRMILHLTNTDDSASLRLPGQSSELRIALQNQPLNDGTYSVTVWLGDEMNLLNDRLGNCISFAVDSSATGSIRSQAPVRLHALWEVRNRSEARIAHHPLSPEAEAVRPS